MSGGSRTWMLIRRVKRLCVVIMMSLMNLKFC